MEFFYIHLLILVTLLIKESSSSGQVGIQLREFINPIGLTIDGDCCDGVNLVEEECPTGKCDHELKVCVSQLDGSEEKCKTFVGPTDSNHIIFSSEGEFLYPFDKWRGGVRISINITDSDTDKIDLVDYYNINVTQPTADSSKELSSLKTIQETGSRDTNATSIKFTVQSYCDRYYYQDCSVKCVDSDDCDGHYKCGNRGQKVCNTGWNGTECNEVVRGSDKDCYKYDINEFDVSNWNTDFDCNRIKGKMVLEVYQVVPSTMEIFVIIKINDFKVAVTGHYNNLGIQLSSNDITVGKNSNLSIFDMSAIKTSETHMAGSFKFRDSPDVCKLALNKISGNDDVIIDGCKKRGTCVRYGESKTQTYCCCFDGTSGKTCDALTTRSPTFITSITTSKSTVTPSPSPSSPTTPETAATSPQSSVSLQSSTPGSTTTSQPTSVPESSTTSPLTTTQQPTFTTQEQSTATSQSITTQPIDNSESTTTLQSTTTQQTVNSESTTTSQSITTQPIDNSESTTMSQLTTTQPTDNSESTTTSQPTTSTLQPTTTPQPTTTMQLSTSPQPTTSPPSTVPTTTEVPKPFVPEETYKLNVAAAPEEIGDDDDDRTNLENLISTAYYEANIGVIEKEMIHTNITERRDAIGDEGALVVEITYILTISSTTVNISLLKQPTTLQWNTILHREYQISIYIGVNMWYLEYTYSIYSVGRPPVYQQYHQLVGEIKGAWEASSSLSKTLFNITVLTTEEYVGEKGEEIYRLYYIVTNTTDIYHPTTLVPPPTSELSKLEMFTMYIGAKWRYRFSYGVIFQDSVQSTEIPELSSLFEKVWSGVNHLNVSIMAKRIERYMGKEGEYLVRILYFVTKTTKVVSPVQWKGPTTTNFKSWLQSIPVNNRYLRVYTSDVHYRFAYHTGIYIADRIDRRDWTNLTTELETTWINLVEDWKEGGFSIKIVTSIDYTTNTSEIVQLLTYYIYKGNQIIDGSLLERLYGINSHLAVSFNVFKTNGDEYKVVTNRLFVELCTQFSFYIQGIISSTDWTYFEQSLVSTWTKTDGYLATDLKVKIHYIQESIDIKSEMTVSKVYYSLMVKSVAVDAYSVMVSKNFSHHLTQSMTVYKNYQAYKLYEMRGSDLVDKRYSYSLYFNTQITRLDFITLKTRLQTVMKTYLGLSYEFEVITAGQEEFYTILNKENFEVSTTRSRVWKINYFIKTNNLWVYPKFVRRIITSEIISELEFSLVNTNKISFYLESTAKLISYNYHFSLEFKETVYVTDWKKIEVELQKAWNIQTGITVDVSIQNIEEFVDIEGYTHYSLIYFVKIQNQWIYSLNWQSLNLSNLKLDFLNMNGNINKFFYRKTEYKLSQSLHVSSQIRIFEKDVSTMKSLLQETWCYTLALYVADCSKIEIYPIKQISSTSSQGITGWNFRYFVKYNGMVISLSELPSFNFKQFSLYSLKHSLSYRFFFNLNKLYRYYRFRLHFKTHIHKTDYSRVSEAILTSWKKHNLKYSTATGIKVIIDSQREKIDTLGESTWEIGYHVEVNGTVLRPESTQPVKLPDLQTEINNKVTGGKYLISTTTTSSLLSTDYFSTLLVNHYIGREDKLKFKSSLETYYRQRISAGSETKVEVTVGPVKQVVTSNGHLSWQLSYHISVNGTSVSIDTLNQHVEHESLQNSLNISTIYGKKVSLVKWVSTKKASSLFSVVFSHKITTAEMTKVRLGLEKSFEAVNPEYKGCGCVGVKVWNQQEQISETGETSWKLHYSVSVRERPVDANLAIWPTWKQLIDFLTIKSGAGYTINVKDTASMKLTSTSVLHSLYFGSYVAESSYTKVKTALVTTWTNILHALGITDNIEFKFRRHTEWSSTLGKSVWKLDYELLVNSTRLDPTALGVDITNFKMLQSAISKLQTPSGSLYELLESSSLTLREYSMHFSLYFTSEIASTDLQLIKNHIQKTWGNHSKVEIHEQKVLIDTEGHYVYELVYYIINQKGEVVDSRFLNYKILTESIASNIQVSNPRGDYYKILTTYFKLIREDRLFNVVINRPLTSSTKMQFLKFLKTVLDSKMPGKNISVDVVQQQEVLTETSLSVWKAKFYVRLNKDYVMPITVEGLSAMELYTLFIKSSEKFNFDLLQVEERYLYSYMNRYVLFFNKNITDYHWSNLESILLETWSNMTEYAACDCLSVKIKGIQEVVDITGFTRFKLVYFLFKNNTIVKSQTTVDINMTLLHHAILHKAEMFQLAEITEHQSTRIDSMFSVYLSYGIRLDHQRQVELFVLQLLNMTNENCCTQIQLLRQMEFITVTGQQLWKVDFGVKSSNQTLDFKLLENLNVTTLQGYMEQFISEIKYQVISSEQMVLDYRQSYSLYITSPVRRSDLTKFQMAINTYFTKQGLESSNFSVLVPQVTQVIDITGILYSKLSVFVSIGNVSAYPGHGDALNITDIQREVQNLGFRGAKSEYTLLQRSTQIETEVQYSNSLEFYIDKPLKKEDWANFQHGLEHGWATAFIEWKWEIDYKIKVTITRQEEYTDMNGKAVFKLIYHLQKHQPTEKHGLELPAYQLPKYSEVKLYNSVHVMVLKYFMVPSVNLVQYSSMFTFYLTSPVLLPDLTTVQNRLKNSWNMYLKDTEVTSVYITSQEEVAVISTRHSQVWQVSYTVTTNTSERIDANYQEELKEVEYSQVLDVNFTTNGESYKDLIVLRPTVSTNLIRYRETYSVFFSQRILQTQYNKFELALASSWNKTKSEMVSVKVVGQQEVISQSGKSAYKLYYSVTKNEKHISSIYTEGLSYTQLSENIDITTSVGTKYTVVDVQRSFKLEAAFQVYVSKAVFRVDRAGFIAAVKEHLKIIMPDENFNDTEVEWRSQTSFLNVKSSVEKIWRQLFIVRRNGQVISAEKQRKLTDLVANFTSLAGQNYTVVSTKMVPGYTKEENVFSISVYGRLSATLSTLTTIIQNTWTAFDSNWTIALREPEEFIGNNGAVVTRIPYIVMQNSSITYPDITRSPEASTVAQTISTQLNTQYTAYTGQKLVKYESCFTLSIRREFTFQIQHTEIIDILKRVWMKETSITEVDISIESTENFVGDYGVKLDQILYTVTLNQVPTEPTFDVQPINKNVQNIIQSDTKYRWSVYSGDNEYRLGVYYSIDVAYSNQMTFTSESRESVETTLTKLWSTRTDIACANCSISIVDRQEKIGYSTLETQQTQTTVSQLHYTVKRGETYLKSYLSVPPTTIDTTTVFNKTDYSVWHQDTYLTRSVYFEGYSRLEKRENFVMGLQEAWKTENMTNVNVTVTKVERYVDENWEKLTKVQYIVSSDNKDPVGSQPESPAITKAFQKVGQQKKSCSCKPLKHRKVFVKGSPSTVKPATVGLAVRAAWIAKNNNASSLNRLFKLNTKDNQQRVKRATTDNSNNQTKYIGKDNEEITPVDYTMSVDGQEPDPIFLSAPSPADLDAAGVKGCNCSPRKAGGLKLSGNVKESSSADIKMAVNDAAVKANPDILPEDLTVDILSITGDITDKNGNELSDVQYAIGRKDNGDIEDVNYPTSAQLDTALKEYGLSLYDKDARQPSEEDNEWKIILGAVCGAIGAVIIVLLIAYVIIQKRKQRNMNLKKQEQDVANNKYDAENFSGSSAYDNKSYETQEAKIEFTDSE